MRGVSHTPVRERPILFTGPMVKAILNGSKTQTRRVVKPQPAQVASGNRPVYEWRGGMFALDTYPANSTILNHCPYGQPGDRLWVKETFMTEGAECRYGMMARGEIPVQCLYRAEPRHCEQVGKMFKWTPSIHMPRWASRITLEVVSVKVERLQDITAADVLKEGGPPNSSIDQVSRGFGYKDFPRSWFAQTWDFINGKTFPWDSNPWVWAIEFRRAAQ